MGVKRTSRQHWFMPDYLDRKAVPLRGFDGVLCPTRLPVPERDDETDTGIEHLLVTDEPRALPIGRPVGGVTLDGQVQRFRGTVGHRVCTARCTVDDRRAAFLNLGESAEDGIVVGPPATAAYEDSHVRCLRTGHAACASSRVSPDIGKPDQQ